MISMLPIIALASTTMAQDVPRRDASTDARIPVIRAILDDGLTDYPSSRFRDVRIVTRPSNAYVTLAVCGQVNSLTRGGGYSGWTRFTILNDRMEVAEGSSLGDRRWAVWCAGSDVVVVEPNITDAITPRPER